MNAPSFSTSYILSDLHGVLKTPAYLSAGCWVTFWFPNFYQNLLPTNIIVEFTVRITLKIEIFL